MIIGGIYLEIYYKIYFSLIYYKIYSSFDIIIITINIAFTFLICPYPIHLAKETDRSYFCRSSNLENNHSLITADQQVALLLAENFYFDYNPVKFSILRI